MTHPWKSQGPKRTIWWYYDPSPIIMQYLMDMRDAIRYGVFEADHLRRVNGKMPSPIDLRRDMKRWFDSRYDYAKHHINPVCRSSISILRSFIKNHRGKKYPEVKRLAMMLDSELVKIVNNSIRITIRPGEYEFMDVNAESKKWEEYPKHKISEVLITDRMIAISFSLPDTKEVSNNVIGMDLNFSNVTGTMIEEGEVKRVMEIPTSNIAGIQNDFSRRRSSLQKHILNPKRRSKKLKQTRGRQMNRIKDALHKLSSTMVKDHPDSSFVLEDLTNMRKSSGPKSKKLRTYLNRWPYSQFQNMLEYKSKNKTVYVNPGGTSSRCPVCGGRLKHPAWKISRCNNCGQDYDRDRLASLAITLRGLYLCGDPFPVSAMASLSSMKGEYLYTRKQPELPDTGTTEMINASNETIYNKVQCFENGYQHPLQPSQSCFKLYTLNRGKN